MRESSADRWYRRLLRCYPVRFRERYEASMRETFRRELDDARTAGGWAVTTFWFWTSIDAVRFGWAERRPRPTGALSMTSFFSVDLRDALRSLRASPIVTLVAVVSLALGIGANTALFSILNSLLLKQLPVKDPARLVLVDDGSWTNPIWEEIRSRRHELFEDAFAWSGTRFNLATSGETDFVQGAWASGNMFDVLGVNAVLGRTFTEKDDVRGGGPDAAVAVVSYGFWQRRLGGTPDVVGRQLTVDGLPVTVIGVAPRGFLGPDVGRSADVMVPIGAISLVPGQGRMLDGRSTWWLEIMARLKPRQSIDAAATALNAIRPQMRAATMPQDWDAKNQAEYLTEPLKLVGAATGDSDLRETYRTPLKIVLAVVAMVLTIACANLANLLLARAASRRHELGVRLALGASRFRLAKQLLAETAMLAAAGAALGLLVARWAGPVLVRQLATAADGVTLDLSLDWRVLAFTVGVTVTTALIFGLAPALSVTGISESDAVKEQTRTVTGDRPFSLRNVLVAVQVALSVTLVVGGVLFVRTLTALSTTPLGFTADGLTTINVDARKADESPEARVQLYTRLRDAAATVPGVSKTAVSVLTPVGNMRWNTVIQPTPLTSSLADRQRLAWVNLVSPGWFDAFGIRVLAGRDFGTHDVKNSPRVLIVSEGFARKYLGDTNPVGQEIRTGLEGPAVNTYRIVGVVNDTIYSQPRRGFEPTIYAPITQIEDVPPSAVVTVRGADGAARPSVRALSAATAAVDSRISFTIGELSTQLRAAVRQERLVAMLAGAFGGLALLLALIGLYGVAAHSVARRRAEIGIRMALGADPGGVVRLILARLGTALLIGVIAGLGLSWWSARLVQQLLFGLEPHDPVTFFAAAAVLLAAGLLAGWIPARRAARIDPVEVLREA